MIRLSVVMLGLTSWALCGICNAAEPPKIIATGEWSTPVADNRAFALRGRLVLCEKNGQSVVYVELQDASESIGGGMQLYCDFGRHDFRPEYKGGLECELRDKNQKPVPTSPFAFGGAVPKSEWVTLPTDGTIRLRSSPFGVGREKARAICPHLAKFWVINDDDPNDYFLSGTFTINPPINDMEKDHKQIWRGKIELPALRIPSKVGAPQP
jgi:hypothetical protein